MIDFSNLFNPLPSPPPTQSQSLSAVSKALLREVKKPLTLWGLGGELQGRAGACGPPALPSS